jgi:hypothetical protein
MYVQIADSLSGPWTYHGDVGSNPGVPFNPHSPNNYVTKAQVRSMPSVLCRARCSLNVAMGYA